MDKIIKVKFEEWQDTAYDNAELWAGNYGQTLQVEGLELPDGNIEVHFSLTQYEGDAQAYIGAVKDNVITVNIPDFILQKENVYMSTYEAYAFIYQTDETSGQTIKKIIFTINARPGTTTDVPEDKKDQFLEEVRQVMAETKEIAQSVREDADRGVFVGPQGPPGIIEYIPCEELPTENINEKATYLVPLAEPEEDNTYAEYKYINGKWERLGGAVIKMDLSEYVKNTDYMAFQKAGVAQVSDSFGIDAFQTGGWQGYLKIVKATNDNIVKKDESYRPIVPSNLDYAVRVSLVDSKEEWADIHKEKARTTLGAVGTTDYATGGVLDGSAIPTAGIVLLNPSGVGGLSISSTNNTLIIAKATHDVINERTPSNYIDNGTYSKNHSRPITPAVLDYAVKKALSDCKLTEDDAWTDDEKTLACSLLNALNLANLGSAFRVASDGNLNLVGASTAQIQNQVNGQNPITPSVLSCAVKEGLVNNKEEWTDEEKAKVLEFLGGVAKALLSVAATKASLALRDDNGRIYSVAPIYDSQVTTKKYVDDLVGGYQPKINESGAGVIAARITSTEGNVNIGIYTRGTDYKEKLLCGSSSGWGLVEISEITRTQLEMQLGDYDSEKGSLQSQIEALRAEIEALKG